jgi:hypothetical protein
MPPRAKELPMRPFLILVLILTLIGSVLVYKMLMSNYRDGFTHTPTSRPTSEPGHSTPAVHEAELIRAYQLPDESPHRLNVKPTDYVPESSSRVRWE